MTGHSGEHDLGDAATETLTLEELGLPQHASIPLRFRPGSRWSPLVISFPHVGLRWPHDLRPKPQVDYPRNADYEVHRLYPFASAFGAATVEAVYSRLVVDLNRSEDDVSGRIVLGHPAPRPRRFPGVPNPEGSSYLPQPSTHRGVVWDRAVGGTPLLTEPLTYAAFVRRLRCFHRPYHRALAILLERRVRRFGVAVLLDAHSMPGSVARDLVVGTLAGTSCAPTLAALALTALDGSFPALPGGETDAVLRVSMDDPYKGGEVIRRSGRPAANVHALQLEVNRGLYMDEDTYRLYSPKDTPRASAALGLRHGGQEIPAALPDAEGAVWSRDPAAAVGPRGAATHIRLAELDRRLRALTQILADPGALARAVPPPVA